MRPEHDAFAGAAEVLEHGLQRGAFPAVAAEVGRTDGPVWQFAGGWLGEDSDAVPANLETVFDLASLTKPIATTSVFMRLVDTERLRLDDEVGAWLPEWRGPDRSTATIADLLGHSSGLTAHLPLYRGCEGRSEFQRAICTLPLEYEPRTKALYSDLGFILLGFIAPLAAHQPLEFLFEEIRSRLEVRTLCFRPPSQWRKTTAPTGLDSWRGRVLIGEVHDRNAWALGGIAGHAGLFGTAPDVGVFAQALLRTLRAATGAGALTTPAVAREFVRRSRIPRSSRAMGWDTMLPTSSCGSLMSATAIGHTGYTGTSLWIDWEHDLYVALLTNRVHPTDENSSILELRPHFHDAVVSAVRALR